MSAAKMGHPTSTEVAALNLRLKVLLAGILAFHAGWYMLVPFFAILFTTRRGLTPAEVGVVLAAQSFTLLLGSLVGGALADRLGRRWTMVGGLALRAAGVALLGLTYGLPGLLASAAVAGVGGGLYGPAAKAAIAVLATGPDKATAFSWRGIAANVGTSSGPLLGGLLVKGPMPVLFGSAAVVHAALAVATWALLPADAAVQDHEERSSWREMLQDVPYLAFSGVTALAWALFSQLALAVPLFAQKVLGLEASIGLLWTTSSLAVIAFQVPVTRYITARLSPATAMAAGVAILGAGLGLVGLARSFTGLLLAVLVFVAGEMLLMPTVDSTVSTMARQGAVGSYFGVASFAWGLGEGLGNLSGGALMQYALSAGRPRLPWPIYTGVGLGLAVLFAVVVRGAKAGVTPTQPPVIRVYRPGQPAPDEAGSLLGPPREPD